MRTAKSGPCCWLAGVGPYISARRTEKDEFTNEAVEVARRVGDKKTLARCLYARIFGAMHLWGAEENLAIANEILQLAEELGDKELLIRGLFMRDRVQHDPG